MSAKKGDPVKLQNENEEEDSDDEEDEDYVPGGGSSEEDDGDFVRTIFYPSHFVSTGQDDGDDVSGDEDDEVVDSEEEGGCDSSSKKRKVSRDEGVEPTKELKKESLSAEEEKAKSDALWAELNGLSSTTKTSKVNTSEADVKPPITLQASVTVESSSTVTSTSSSISSSNSEALPSKSSTSTTSSSTSSQLVPQIRKSGGLNSLAASLGKTKGPSTLLQSKQDWETFKSESGLTEELAEHTKGKDSFVERQAFISRADVRQFEKEKEIRDKIRARRPLP